VPADPAEEARIWFTQATEDLSAARHLASNADMPPRLAAFLAHLAAEKALKATLIARGVAIRTTRIPRPSDVLDATQTAVRSEPDGRVGPVTVGDHE
jgi:HEPN domain-containing protein